MPASLRGDTTEMRLGEPCTGCSKLSREPCMWWGERPREPTAAFRILSPHPVRESGLLTEQKQIAALLNLR